MEILGVGPSELVFIVIIALIVLGPKDMQKAGKTIGKFLRNIVTSDGWKMWQKTSREMRTLPNRLIREANDEINNVEGELLKEINKAVSSASKMETGEESSSMKTPPRSQPMPDTLPENRIAPPAPETKINESDREKDA